MSKMIAGILLVSIAIILLPALALAADVTSTDLIEKAKELDGQEVMFTGEVIGDIMVRGNHTWINVSDGSNAIGVYAQSQSLWEVTLPGRYGIHGDTVRVTGEFRRACPEHGGDLDIHLISVQLMEKGYPVPLGVEPWKLPAAAILALLTLVLFAYMIRKRRGHP